MVVIESDRRPKRAPQRGRDQRSADGQVVGALLVLGGIGWLLQQSGLVDLSATTMLSALLVTLGIGLVATARRAGGGGLVVLGLALTVVLASATAVDTTLLQRGVGERTFAPTSAAELDDPFQLGVGSLTLDLRGLEPEELADQRLRAQIGLGELVVVLPPEDVVPVAIVAEARAGEIDLLEVGQEDGGTNLRRRFEDDVTGDAAASRLELDLDVGLGSIQVVRRAPR